MQNRTFKKGNTKIISLFLLLHGIGILKTSFNMINSTRSPNFIFDISIDTYYIFGFIIGLILIIDAIGLLIKGKFFYTMTMIIALGAIAYIIFSIYTILINGLSTEFPVVLFLIIFLMIYGGIFINIKSRFHVR